MNISILNGLMIKNDINNRLYRGKKYYSDGLVLDIKSVLDKDYGSLDIYGKVMSDNDFNVYDTNISFDIRKENLIYTECNCTDFQNNCDFNSTYVCKHIGATFYKFLDEVNSKVNKLNCIEDTAGKIFSEELDFSELFLNEINNVINNNKEKISLKVAVTKVNNKRDKFYYEVDLKIGSKKYYVVKSISDLIQARRYNRDLYYGKEFTYKPHLYYFSDNDEKLLEFLEEYVVLAEPFEKEYSAQRVANNILGKNKTLFLSQGALRRFLSALVDREIVYNENNNSTEILIVNEDLPLAFNISEKDEVIEVEAMDNMPKAMTYKNDVYIHQDKIYLPNENQLRYFSGINNIFTNQKTIKFKDEKKHEIINKVIPLLEMISKDINIEEDLKRNIIKEELELEIYFDRERNKTWAEVIAKYGEISFNLLNGPKENEYVIRDLKKENIVENLLNKLNFYRDKTYFYFHGDDEKLFELLSNDLEELKEKATIFYSDRFKERKIYKGAAISANISEGKDNYLEFTFNIEKVSEKELREIIQSFKENRKFFKLKDESFLDLRDEEVAEFLDLLDDLNDGETLEDNTIKVHKNKAVFLNESINNKLPFVKGKEVVNHIANKIEELEAIDYEVPKDLKATLREYQITGYKWFKTLSHYEFGGILADEMGLGKTLQTIAFLLSEKGKKSLIVTPTSLIYNWKSEFEKFAPTMKIKIVHGNKEERQFIESDIEDVDVILTTYGTLRNDFDLYKNIIFDFCIIDEGQNIKNPLSQSSEVVKEINAKVKFALTGTPIENNLLELWSLFDYVMPKYLYGKKKFQEKFIKKDGDINRLKKLIRPFILRRLKKEVMSELPDKIEKTYFVEMTDDQRKVYRAYTEDIKIKMENTDINKDKITIFSYLTKLRQLSLDPSILVDGYKGGSGKIDTTVEILHDFINEDHKILLFSQFTTVLENIKRVLQAEGINYLYLDGSVKASERVQLVEEFNKSKSVKVFLISLKAGGTGLNLTSADIVVHFDPWWNPAIEDQATDRAHRFGQKKSVEVIKLISKGSIEEKILKLQENKKEIIKEIMNGNYTNGGFLSSLNEEELKELFD